MTFYVLVALIFATAGIAQNVAGFGFGMVSIPLLAAVATPREAVVAGTALNLVLTGATAAVERRRVDVPTTLRLSLASMAGMPLGLLILHRIPAPALTIAIALVVTGCAMLVLRGWRLPPRPAGIVATGALSGMLLTATGTNGPPLVAALQALGMEQRRFRATLAAVFTLSGLIGVAGFFVTGAFHGRVPEICAAGLVGTLVGGGIGDVAFRRFDPTAFRRVVLGVLFAAAGIALARAAAQL